MSEKIRMQTDLVNYMTDMKAMVSHLQACRSVSSGIYRSNPVSRGLNCFHDLDSQIDGMIAEIDRAHVSAAEKLGASLREGQG